MKILRIQCGRCSFTSTRPSDFSDHANREHPLRFRCTRCTFSSDVAEDLRDHEAAIHDGTIEEVRRKRDSDGKWIVVWPANKVRVVDDTDEEKGELEEETKASEVDAKEASVSPVMIMIAKRQPTTESDEEEISFKSPATVPDMVPTPKKSPVPAFVDVKCPAGGESPAKESPVLASVNLKCSADVETTPQDPARPSASADLKCSLCDFSTSTARGMKMHVTRKHTDPILCKLCGAKAASQKKLTAHIIAEHAIID